jgi:hypothetical protein
MLNPSNLNPTQALSTTNPAADAVGLLPQPNLVLPPLNTAPIASSDSFTTSEDTPLSVTSTLGLLANDTNTESNPLTAILVNGPSNGTLVLNADGSFTYTATSNYNGADSFTYRANDGELDSDIATVILNISAVNDLPTGTATALLPAGSEDTAYTINTTALLQGFSDVDGDPLAIVALTATNGTLINNNNGTYTFQPNQNYNGIVNLSYNVIDGQGGTIAATQSFTLAAVNDAPVITNPTSLNLLSVVTPSPFTIITNPSALTTQAISGISISDVDAGTGKLTTTLSVNYGKLTIANLNGSTVTGGALNSNTVSLTGTLTQLNQALASLRYDTNFFNGNANLNITVNDNGNTGGSPQIATKTTTLRLASDLGTLQSFWPTNFANSASIDPNDTIDRYRFTLGSATSNFRLSLTEQTANHDVFLLNSQGTVLRSSTNANLTNESFSGVSLPAGEYFVEIRRIGTPPRNTAGYRLRLWR